MRILDTVKCLLSMLYDTPPYWVEQMPFIDFVNSATFDLAFAFAIKYAVMGDMIIKKAKIDTINIIISILCIYSI